ncbi:sulfide-dependent adenosine diphosphate thiazole synthase [Methanospirillum purgamenti]|uniref:Thiamine thiazole synthase n=1 Tax=Methanospirillum hungatei TaxID=2203 RepID=A0A8F5ZF33_METHU|nr:sulfide-dependent adenosine diphosphate thiazole synthase [Methanospirillum hungatei]QXO94074.1 sulfide-dependent adenosine diphosphate thiazole synthase [Methanospirillum hungatei]
MTLDEITISRAIISDHMETLLDYMEMDVAVVGGGPSGLVCSALIAEKGYKVGLIEKKLSIGGGMWGGGMMFPRIVVQEEARRLLDRFHINYSEFSSGYYTARSIEAVSKLTAAASDAGVEFFNLTTVEDVMVKGDGVLSGLVINWQPVEATGLHVDPLTLACKITVDATGHDAVISHQVAKKCGKPEIKGEGTMWAENAETAVVSHTKEVFPGLYVCGMAANAVLGGHRMGPVFGGMLLSGEAAALQIVNRL